MAPTIRIDDEVYAWLQEKARAFEDTPNSVLRRVAGFEADGKQPTERSDAAVHEKTATKTPHSATARPRAIGRRGTSGLTGQQLNDEWKVGARHALYHADGHFFENLERFPGALFDRHGYVVFKTEESFKNSTYVKIGKKTNVLRGIYRMPGYVRKA